MTVELKKYLNMNRNLEGYESYKNMPHEFRPYVMFVNCPNYSSDHINTDELGFRKSTNKKGDLCGINFLISSRFKFIFLYYSL